MYEARGRFEWNQTSHLIAAVFGIMHDPKKGKAPSPDDFNPYSRKAERKKQVTQVPVSFLKEVFVKK